MLVNGKWVENWQPVQASDGKGGFVRQTSSFRNWITPDGSPGPTGEGGFKAEAGRYHLYVALICPWASRTLIGRKLKKARRRHLALGGRAGADRAGLPAHPVRAALSPIRRAHDRDRLRCILPRPDGRALATGGAGAAAMA